MRTTLTLTTERAPDLTVQLTLSTTRDREAMPPAPQPSFRDVVIREQDRAEEVGAP